MKVFLKVIDLISDKIGRTACWLAAALVGLISFEIILRYVFDSPTVWNFETSLMTGGTMMAFGWAYAQRHHFHIRVDVFYSRWSPRVRAAIDVFGALIFFFPLVVSFAVMATMRAQFAWATGQVSNLTYWYPPVAPFRTVIALAFILLAMQGLVQFIRDLYLLIRNKAYD